MPARVDDTSIAAAFPGVGVPLCGAERDFYRRHRLRMTAFMEEASAAAEVDLGGALEREKLSGLDQRAREIFTYAFSCGVYAVCLHRGMEAACMAGNSMGVYSALVSSGSLAFSDGLRLVEEAHRLTREACPERNFGMGAVVGLEERDIHKLLEKPGRDSVMQVNSNNPSFKVLAGLRDELDELLREAEAEGAFKAVPMNLGVPYHHPRYLAAASREFEPVLQRLEWRRPRCPIISSVDRRTLTTPEELKDFTARNLSTPIDWEAVVVALGRRGATLAIECGPGVSLSQSAHLIDGAPRHVNLRNFKGTIGI